MSTAEREHRFRKRPFVTVNLNGEEDDDSDIEEIPVKLPRKSEQPSNKDEGSYIKNNLMEFLSWMSSKPMFLSFVNSVLKALGIKEIDCDMNEAREVQIEQESDDSDELGENICLSPLLESSSTMSQQMSPHSDQERRSHSVSDRRNNFYTFGNQYRSERFLGPSQRLFSSPTNNISQNYFTEGHLKSSLNYRSPFRANGHSRPPKSFFNRSYLSSKKTKEENEENEVTVIEDKSWKLLHKSNIIKDRSHVPLRRKINTDDDIVLIKAVPPSDVLLSRTKLVLRSNNTSVSDRSNGAHSRSLTSPRGASKFTTNDVINMQEKEVYKMLLDNYFCAPACVREEKLPLYKRLQAQVKALDIKKTSPDKKDVHEKFLEEYKQELDVAPVDTLPKPKAARPIFKQLAPEDEVLFLGEKPFKYKEKPTKPLSIPPVPASPFMCKEWIAKLKQTMEEETEKCMKIAAEHNRQIEESRRKVREELEAKALAEASLADRAEDFPELTPEMESIIDNALIPIPPDEVLSQLNQQQVLRKDMETLNNRNWLNDEVINFYLMLIQERSKQRTDLPSVYAFSSFLFPNLKSKGYPSVRRWTRKVDIFSYDIILVPVHLGVHWCLAVIDFRHKHIGYYDSMGGHETCLEVLKNYLILESLDKKKKALDMSDWNFEVMKKIPPQLNGYDCGMFTLKYAEYVTRDAPITFNQQNMQYFRRMMVYEILMQKIL